MKLKYFSIFFVIGALLWMTSSNESTSEQKSVSSKKPFTKATPLPNEPSNSIGIESPSINASSPIRMVAQKTESPWSELEKLEACYRKEGQCGFSQSDPKAEFFGIGQKIKKRLLSLEFEARTNNIQNAQLAELARHHLSNPDGHVKEAALHLMASQEADIKNLDALIEDVINHHDARLIPHALLELTRYLGNGQDQKIHNGLIQAMLRGSPFVSLAIAQGIGPFLNSESLTVYEVALKNLGATSQTKWHLQTTLEEYKKLESAG